MTLWRSTRTFRTNTKYIYTYICVCVYIHISFSSWGMEYKSRKSRDIWSNSQVWPWSTKWSRAKAEFCQENILVTANNLFQQHKRRLYTWTSPDGQYLNQIDYIVCSWRWRSSIQSAKSRQGIDCSSDHELLFEKFTQIEECRKNH